MAVTHRARLDVVTALRADHLVDLLGHQFGQHPEPDTDAQRQQPLLRRASKFAERLLHALGQRVELREADRVGPVVYVLHGGSPSLEWSCSHSPRCQQQRTRREDRHHFKFYELRDNLGRRARRASERRACCASANRRYCRGASLVCCRCRRRRNH